jgi:hypothetical protein
MCEHGITEQELRLIDVEGEHGGKVIITGIRNRCTAQELHIHFERVGKVRVASVVHPELGIAIVRYATVASAETAVQDMDRTTFGEEGDNIRAELYPTLAEGGVAALMKRCRRDIEKEAAEKSKGRNKGKANAGL